MNKKVICGCLAGAAILIMGIETVLLLNYKDGYEAASRSIMQMEAKQQSISVSANKMLDTARTVEQIVEANYLYDIDSDTMTEGLLTGMLWGIGDPYAAYYNTEDLEALTIESAGEYSGVGAVITQQEDGTVIVVKVYPNSPSADEGLLPGDVFYEIDGVNVVGEDSSTIAAKLKGEAGTEVEVNIYRAAIDEYIPFTFTRRQIEIPSVSWYMAEGNIGVMKIESWDLATVNQFKTGMQELTDAGCVGLVIDVRNNPGGIVQAAVDIVDYFVPDGGRIVYTVDKNKKEEVYPAQDGNDSDIPLVVLMNGNSASASEIFAGAIKDYKAGTLVGETSYGKGIVQKVFAVGESDAVKLTIAEYYLPNNECIHKKGVEPDVRASLSAEAAQKAELPEEEDTQLQEAFKLLGR